MWKLDFSNETPEQVDLAAGTIPAGYHRARLESQDDDLETGAKRLTFKLSHGLHTGKRLTERVNNPDFVDGDESKMWAAKRAKIFVTRMGAIPRDATGIVEPDWARCVGQEYVIKVKHREYQGKSGTATAVEVDFGGIFDLNHKDIPVEARVDLGLPLLPGQKPPKERKAGADATTAVAAGGATQAAPAKDAAAAAAALFG
jgi:hypothetical protein